MATLTGQTISSTYDGLLKTTDNDVLNADGKEITDGLGNGSGVSLDTNGNIVAQGTVKAIGGVRDTSNDLGTSGQVLSSTGGGTNWVNPPIADDSVTYAKLGVEFTDTNALGSISGTQALDFSADQIFTATLTGNTTFTVSNAQPGMVKDLYVTGDFTLAITNGAKIAGDYDGTVESFIQIVVKTPTSFKYSISQDAV